MNQYTFSFPQIVNRISGKIELSDNVQSINECLGILLRTLPGELLGNPDWGCKLLSRIFQYQGIIIDTLIKDDIMTAIQKYEPRIIVDTNDIILETDVNFVNIYINYTIKETGEINSFNLEITPDDNPDKYR